MNEAAPAVGKPRIEFSRVLIVDCESDFCRELNKRLTVAGLDVSCCSSIAEAELLLDRDWFAAAAVDWALAEPIFRQDSASQFRQWVFPHRGVAWRTRIVFFSTADAAPSLPDELRSCRFVHVDKEWDSLLASIQQAVNLSMRDALAESELRYRLLMEGVNDSVFIVDAETARIVDANQKARQLVGYSLDELRGMQQFDIHPETDRPLLVSVFDQRKAERRGLVTELNVLHRGGRRIPVEISCSDLSSTGPPLIQIVLRNATARKRSEQALRMSDERFRQLTENIDEVFWLIDWSTLSALYVSPAYESIWGRSTESAVASPDGPISFVHEDDSLRVREAFRWEAPNGRFDEEFRIVRPTGEVRWIRQRAFPIHNASGELYRIAAIANDVTERRLVQDELQKRNSELAHLSRLSTMGELVAELAHEINQPLYAISNYADACSNILKTQPANLHEFLDQWTTQIGIQSKRAGEIIRRIGRFLRKDTSNPTEVDLNELIQGTVELLEVDFSSQQVNVCCELADGLAPVVVTQLHIEQVLVNLLRNAVDAMRDTPPTNRTITIRTQEVSPRMVEVAVTDNGPGIAVPDGDHIFEPFFTTKRDGIGLGLAICQSTIRTYGGTIHFSTGPSGGTTFRFTLPAAVRGIHDLELSVEPEHSAKSHSSAEG